MIATEQALDILEQHSFGAVATKKHDRLRVRSASLAEARNHFLAQEICADRDFPPFDRVRMDGIAIDSRTWHSQQASTTQTRYAVQEIAAAGAPQCHLRDAKKNCIEVMTGAIVPQGCDAIIPYEDLQIIDGFAGMFRCKEVHAGQNIHFEGSDIPQGKIILPKGVRLGAVQTSILAAVGQASVQIYCPPRAAIVSTGDELVAVEERQPKIFEIRRSNAYALQSKLQGWGIDAAMSHLADDREVLLQKVADLLEEFDVLIFTGGVSKGKFDYLPGVFEELQIRRLFHKISQRPGKPFWFGLAEDVGKCIFGLPGNPVSSLVCLCMYFRHWYFSSPQFAISSREDVATAMLTNDVHFAPDLTYFLEGKVVGDKAGCLQVEARPGNGSGDFINLARADGFLILPRGRSVFKKGERVPFLYYRERD